MSRETITGKWKLISFDLKKDGVWSPWGEDTRGSLSYGQDGTMWVEIDKNLSSENRNDSDILHYAGTYELHDNRIFHTVTEASDPARVGQDLVRDVEFVDGKMILSGNSASGTQFKLTWERN